MCKKPVFIILLLAAALSVTAAGTASFRLTASDILYVKVSQDRTGLFSFDSMRLTAKSLKLTLDTSKLTVTAQPFRFTAYKNGGGSAELLLQNFTAGLSLRTDGNSDPDKVGRLYRTMRAVSDRHLTLAFLVKAKNYAELEFQVHLDRSYGLYADTRIKFEYWYRAIDIMLERTLSESIKNDFRLDFGSLFGVRFVTTKGAKPVFGGTARKQERTADIWLRKGHVKFKTSHTVKVNADTGMENHSTYELTLESNTLDLKASAKLTRTEGSSYTFSRPKVSVTLKFETQTPYGTLSVRLKEDRSLRIVFSSEVSHVGAGKLGLTCDIDP